MRSLKLLTPVKLGDLTIKNRVALAPLTRGRSGDSRVPNEWNIEYYKQRANAGLVITEATSISPQGNGWSQSAGIYTEEMSQGWAKVVDAVHKQDSKIFCQLWHLGRASHSSFQINNQQIVGPSAIAIQGEGLYDANGQKRPHEVPRALETSEVPLVVADYRNAARLAKLAGFDGVEIHGANGYLIDQFLQPKSNIRTDIYGGSVANRYRFLGEIVEAIQEVYPAHRIGVRLSPNGAYNDMGSEDNWETFGYAISALNKVGLAYLHMMDGLGFGFHQKCPPMTLADARKLFSGPIIGNVDYTRDTAEAAIQSGNADLIAFGRPYISNPDLVYRFENDLPLAKSNPATWFTHGKEGYIDYPTYQEAQSKI